MRYERRGVVEGGAVVLDEAVPQLEGRRVLVFIEPELTCEQAAEVWSHWLTSGPQGPIADEDESDVP